MKKFGQGLIVVSFAWFALELLVNPIYALTMILGIWIIVSAY